MFILLNVLEGGMGETSFKKFPLTVSRKTTIYPSVVATMTPK